MIFMILKRPMSHNMSACASGLNDLGLAAVVIPHLCYAGERSITTANFHRILSDWSLLRKAFIRAAKTPST
jgi:hypothetical protein